MNPRVLALSSLLLLGCSSNESTATPASDTGSADTAMIDSGASDTGATPDTTTSDAPSVDAPSDTGALEGGPVETGGVCTFNRECALSDRCECNEGDCRCKPGARGTGKNGVDTCTSGNDCESSLCVEGSDGKSYCSDECTSDTDCKSALPKCLDVAFLGRICVRASM